MNTRDSDPKPATQAKLRSILGDLDDATALEILGLSPTVADLEEAVTWASGSGDVLGKRRSLEHQHVTARGERKPEARAAEEARVLALVEFAGGRRQ